MHILYHRLAHMAAALFEAPSLVEFFHENVFPIFGDRNGCHLTIGPDPNKMKIIAAINMTLDGFCDHTAMIADAELHAHYTELLKSAGAILYGRITYQLMESYWPAIVKKPTGDQATDDFAAAIQDIPKIVFSNALKKANASAIDPVAKGWENARLAKADISEEVLKLKQSAGVGSSKDVLVGSRSLIMALINLELIDELQLTVHPVIAGNGLPLFKDISARTIFKLIRTRTVGSSGWVTLYYEPAQKLRPS